MNNLSFMQYSSVSPFKYNYKLVSDLNETESKIIELIKNGSLTSELSEYIHRIIDSTVNKDIIIDLIEARGIPNEYANLIFEAAVKYDSYKELQKILIKGIDFEGIRTHGNIIDEIQKPSRLNNEFFEWLFNFRPAQGGVQCGAGEYFLRLVFTHGCTPDHGDLRVGDTNIELKSTQNKKSGFRMKGQCGYGNGHSSLLTALNAVNIDHSDFDHNDYQLFFKNKRSRIQEILASRSIDDRRLFYQTYFDENYIYLRKTHPEIVMKAYSKIEGLTFAGCIDTISIMPIVAALEFLYYATMEEWDYFMTINHMKDYLIIDPSLRFNQIEHIFERYFKFTSLPNTKPNSTPQDSVLGVALL